ncbi:TPA: hypothetical protein ACIVOM_003612 [Salmonella enterica subsp. enterica serovar Virchow]
MMLPSELIKDETEFKHSCSVYGKETVKILRYIQDQLQTRWKGETQQRKRDAIWYQSNNIDLLINEIADANTATAPDFTL